jgi:hypothetical protein
MRATVGRPLTCYGYPLDKKPAAITLVMDQVEVVTAPA